MAALDKAYDAPEYNITRDCQMDRVKPAVSTLYYAQFYARARMYVTNVVVGLRSAASVAAITVAMGHKISANVAFSVVASSTLAWISATSVGSYHTLALNRTLAAGEYLGLLFNEPTGEFHVTYEFQILPT
jgi:hypothetical protein